MKCLTLAVTQTLAFSGASAALRPGLNVATLSFQSRKLSQSIEGGAGIWIRIKTLVPGSAYAAPLPEQHGVPEQIRADRQPVEAPLVEFGTDPGECDRIRKQ